MKRTKKIVILSHCILNVNSKVEGECNFGDVSSNLVKYLLDNDYGIIQLPCPEMTLYGIKRWGHVKEQFNTPFYRKHCREIFKPILEQIENYRSNGYKICSIVAVDGSPSCGFNYTCSSEKWGGEFSYTENIDEKINDLKVINRPGIFIEEIEHMLLEKGLKINVIAIDESSENFDTKLLDTDFIP